MAQEFARKFYDSTAWRKCRGAYIQHRMAVDGGMCETCHERPGYIVHHKKMLTALNIRHLLLAAELWQMKKNGRE